MTNSTEPSGWLIGISDPNAPMSPGMIRYLGIREGFREGVLVGGVCGIIVGAAIAVALGRLLS